MSLRLAHPVSQDLSVAGQRKGLLHADLGDEETSRSGLFMEAVRIIKEMRASDIRNGRHGIYVRPRYAVYENVPGALSSNKGQDWQTVLTELIRIVEPTAPDVPMPDKTGWPHAGCFYGKLGNWSCAYRLHDAQWWGVPQRRKRLAICVDFAGLTAPEILFDPQLRGETEGPEPDQAVADPSAGCGPEVQAESSCLSGHPESCRAEGQGTPGGSAEGADGTGAFGIDQQGGKGGANYTVGVAPTIASDSHGTPHAVSFRERSGKPGGAKESSVNLKRQEHWPPLTSSMSRDSQTDAPTFSIQGNVVDRTPKQNGGYLSGPITHPEQRGPSCGFCGRLSERSREPFCERHSASEGVLSEPEQQQCCQSANDVTGGGTSLTYLTPSEQRQTAITVTQKPTSQSQQGKMSAGFKPRQSSAARSLGYEVERSPTINTDENYATHIYGGQ